MGNLPHAQLTRYFAQGSMVILFDGPLTNPGEVEEELIVSNGQFDITLKIRKANVVSSFAPDMLHLTVDNIFSYTSYEKLTKKQLVSMQTNILNGHNISIPNNPFPYEHNIVSINVFWDMMSFREVEHLDISK